MSATLSIHNAWLSVIREYPSNSNYIAISTGEGHPTIGMYLTNDQWWVMRTAIPKGKDYVFHGKDGKAVYDHAEADRLADDQYFQERELLANLETSSEAAE